jgi:HTH-type transcriptional regulator/antitoxin HipB
MRIRTATDLGLVVRERRRALGLDQRTLAERAGVSRQWIVAIERGKAGAAIGLLLRVMGTLGLRLDAASERPEGSTGAAPTRVRGIASDADIAAVIDRARGRGR